MSDHYDMYVKEFEEGRRANKCIRELRIRLEAADKRIAEWQRSDRRFRTVIDVNDRLKEKVAELEDKVKTKDIIICQLNRRLDDIGAQC